MNLFLQIASESGAHIHNTQLFYGSDSGIVEDTTTHCVTGTLLVRWEVVEGGGGQTWSASTVCSSTTAELLQTRGCTHCVCHLLLAEQACRGIKPKGKEAALVICSQLPNCSAKYKPSDTSIVSAITQPKQRSFINSKPLTRNFQDREAASALQRLPQLACSSSRRQTCALERCMGTGKPFEELSSLSW